jgi:hypothetical protein
MDWNKRKEISVCAIIVLIILAICCYCGSATFLDDMQQHYSDTLPEQSRILYEVPVFGTIGDNITYRGIENNELLFAYATKDGIITANFRYIEGETYCFATGAENKTTTLKAVRVTGISEKLSYCL